MNKTLNPKIWNSDETLKTVVYDDLVKISSHFITFTKIAETSVKDIIFVGSMANYNWHAKSDIDLHIIYDSSKYSLEQQELIKEYLLDKKALWNFKHKISIYGYPVELYPEFDTDNNVHNSIYSIKFNKWILEPIYTDIDSEIESKKYEVNKKYDDYVNEINYLYTLDKVKDINYEALLDKIIELKKTIWKLRSDSLLEGGIYSVGNLVFKELRNNDYLQKLIDLELAIHDKDLTLEGTLILKEFLFGENKEISLESVKYKLDNPAKNMLIFVSPSKLLDRLAKDSPDFDVTNVKNQIGKRVEKAKEFIKNYWTDQHLIDPKTGERSSRNEVAFEPSIVGIYNGKIGFQDGRHRVLAAKELGIDKIGIEIPKNQKDLFNDLY